MPDIPSLSPGLHRQLREDFEHAQRSGQGDPFTLAERAVALFAGELAQVAEQRDTLVGAVLGEQDYVHAAATDGAEGTPGYDEPDSEYHAALAQAPEMHRLLQVRAERLVDVEKQFEEVKRQAGRDAFELSEALGEACQSWAAQQQRAEKAEAEVERLQGDAVNALVNQTQLRTMSVQDGAAQLEIIPSREIVIAWVLAAREMLGDAPNYAETPVEMEIGAAGEPERYIVTVQRAGKITPHQARQKAEAERDAAIERAEKAERELRSHRCTAAVDRDQVAAAVAEHFAGGSYESRVVREAIPRITSYVLAAAGRQPVNPAGLTQLLGGDVQVTLYSPGTYEGDDQVTTIGDAIELMRDGADSNEIAHTALETLRKAGTR